MLACWNWLCCIMDEGKGTKIFPNRCQNGSKSKKNFLPIWIYNDDGKRKLDTRQIHPVMFPNKLCNRSIMPSEVNWNEVKSTLSFSFMIWYDTHRHSVHQHRKVEGKLISQNKSSCLPIARALSSTTLHINITNKEGSFSVTTLKLFPYCHDLL